MDDEPVTLVRYGLMGHVGPFAGTLPGEPATGPERGRLLVIRTDRGEELGEVLLHLPSASCERKPWRQSRDASAAAPSTLMADDWADRPRLVRAALSEDLENSRQAERLRGERFDLCRQILGEGRWPLELLDVEPLLDLDTTVLHLLGPSGLDLDLLRAEFRGRCDFRVVFEYLASCTGSSLGGATEPYSALARGRCECCDCAEGFAPACQDCASNAEKETREQSSSAALASCGDQAHTSCEVCEIEKWFAGTR